MTKQKLILKEVEVYYKNLFKKDKNTGVDNLDHLTNIRGLRQLTDPEAKQIDKDLTVEKLGNTLKKMSNGKSPGIGAFPCELFKVF